MGAIWSQAGNLLYKLLEFLYHITNSYGLSIVLLTILVRIILYPLNQKQMVSMQQMQRIQPKLKMLQKKYENDKQKLTEETMRLYREYKVNPTAGCLPLLIQLPILILLFSVLRKYDFGDVSFLGVLLSSTTSAGLAQACGAPATDSILTALNAVLQNPSGLANVGYYLGNLVLLVVVSVLTWAQQKFSGAGDNQQMAMMSTIMPFFMAFICFSMPGGVMLYWGLSSLIGVLQQLFVIKKTKKEIEIEGKPTLYKNKPVEGSKNEVYSIEQSKNNDDDDDEYEDDDDYDYDDDEEDEQ